MKNSVLIGFAILLAILISIIAFLIGLSIGVGSQGEIVLTDDSMSAWISAIATVCIAILTIVLSVETWRLRKFQTDQIDQLKLESIKPSINFYLEPAASSLGLLNVLISNNGKGSANNVRFEFRNLSNDAKDVFDYLSEKIDKLTILKIWYQFFFCRRNQEKLSF